MARRAHAAQVIKLRFSDDCGADCGTRARNRFVLLGTTRYGMYRDVHEPFRVSPSDAERSRARSVLLIRRPRVRDPPASPMPRRVTAPRWWLVATMWDILWGVHLSVRFSNWSCRRAEDGSDGTDGIRRTDGEPLRAGLGCSGLHVRWTHNMRRPCDSHRSFWTRPFLLASPSRSAGKRASVALRGGKPSRRTGRRLTPMSFDSTR